MAEGYGSGAYGFGVYGGIGAVTGDSYALKIWDELQNNFQAAWDGSANAEDDTVVFTDAENLINNSVYDLTDSEVSFALEPINPIVNVYGGESIYGGEPIYGGDSLDYGEFLFQILPFDNAWAIEATLHGDKLEFSLFDGTTHQGQSSDFYDPVEDLFWRISESNNVVRFATSPDGIKWTEKSSVATDRVTSLVYCYMEYTAPVATGGSSGFGSYSDTFDTTIDPTRWIYVGSSSTSGSLTVPAPSVVSGRIKIDAAKDGTGSTTSGIASWDYETFDSNYYNLTSVGDEVSFELDMNGSGAVSRMSLIVYDVAGSTPATDDSLIRIEVGENWTGPNQVYMEYYDEGTDTNEYDGTTTYNPTAHRWLRLRYADVLIFEASPDGVTWSELFRSTVPVPLTHAVVDIAYRSRGAGDASSTAYLDNFQITSAGGGGGASEPASATVSKMNWAHHLTQTPSLMARLL